MTRGKKVICAIGIAVLTAGAFLSGHYAGAASKTPGSEGDPLITLSYLEGRLAGHGGGLQRVQLNRGQRIIGKAGTSIIVFGGSVTAAGGSLVDVTQGVQAEEDTSMFLYHSYIVPEENAGCEALSSCTLFVGGEYTIK